MDTYGDLVTLLLTFFVLLFSFSSIDAKKWEALVGSFTGVNAIGIEPISPEIAFENPIPRFGPPAMEDMEMGQEGDEPLDPDDPANNDAASNLDAIYEHITGFINQGGINVEVIRDDEAYILRILVPDMVFFDTADATVKEEAKPVIDQIIEMLLGIERLYSELKVEGHTDNRPINTPRYPSNWDVSADRAIKVVSYIRIDGRLDKDKLSAAGYGEERPIADNDTVDGGMARNRRVEFVIESIGRRP